MASFGNSDDYAVRPAKPPVSQHPAFPAIVALWFAVLLGLGSLVLPAPVVGRVIAASGIARLIPAAAPPPSLAARGLIAIAAAVVGALAGLAVARRVASASRMARKAHRPQDHEPRPISAHDELGEGNLAAAPASRRRTLAVAGEADAGEFLEVAPLPGRDPRLHIDHHAHEGENDEPLDLLELSEAQQIEPGTAPAERQVFQATPPATAAPEEKPAEQAPAPGPHAHETTAEEAPSAPAPVSLPLEQLHDPASPDPGKPAALATISASEEQANNPAPTSEDGTDTGADEASEAIATAPLEELGLVQLAQRLGQSIGKLRASRAAQPSPEPVAAPTRPDTIPDRIDTAQPEDAVERMTEFFADDAAPEPTPAPAIEEQQGNDPVEAHDSLPLVDEFAARDGAIARTPFSLVPFDALGEDEDDEALDELAASFSLPLDNRTGAVSPAVSYTAVPPPSSKDAPEEPEQPAERPADNDDGDAPANEDMTDSNDESFALLIGSRSPFHEGPANVVPIAPDADFVLDDEPGPAPAVPAASTPDAVPPPVAPVAQPNKPVANSAENQQALREALLNLQRVNSSH